MEEKLLDSESWKLEAQAVINDVKAHVKDLKISEKIESNDRSIYLNLTTIEDKNFCIQLSAQGFKIVGNNYDKVDIDSEVYFETPYSLLNSISPKYKDSFANALLGKLNAL